MFDFNRMFITISPTRLIFLLVLCVIISVPMSTVWASPKGDSWNVELVGREPFGPAHAVYIANDYAYLCAGGTLVILDVSNPFRPAEVGRIDTPWIGEGIHVVGDYAYVADGDEGLRVIDVSDPISPREVGSYDIHGRAYEIYVAEGYAYVAGSRGLRVIDVSDPVNPHVAGFCDTPEWAVGVHVVGKYAYVADEDEGLRVIDVSDPKDPDEVGFCNTPGGAEEVYVVGNYAYVADWRGGLRVIDVSDPMNPRKAGFYDTAGRACGVYVARGYVYVADRDGGLCILRFAGAAGDMVEPEGGLETMPSAAIAFRSYPNPFNPEMGSVNIRYSLSKDANVTIEIYDANGELVTALIKEEPKERIVEYSESWNGRNDQGDIVANGVYFYLITTTGDEKAAGKIAVLR